MNLAVKVTVHETGDAYEAGIGLSGRGSGVMLAVAEAGPASTSPGSLVTCRQLVVSVSAVRLLDEMGAL